MNKNVVAAAALCWLACAAQAKDAFDSAELAWLEGRWAGSKDGVETEEIWTSPKGNALLGVHRDVKNGRMISFEFFRIDTTAEGTFYFASPGGRTPVPFKLVGLESKRVVFENKDHDFPQRILYWLDERGALHARIEGTTGGKVAGEEWTWMKQR
jgi:hypothetical protein